MRYTTIIIIVAALLGAATLLRSQAEELTVPETFLNLPKFAKVMVIAVETGRLPDGAELHLELEDGTFVGSVAPFGQTAVAVEIQSHLVLVQLNKLPAGNFKVIPILVHSEGRRKANSTEFIGIQVVEIKE